MYNDNRRMMMEMLAPLSQQLMDMRTLYEGSKHENREMTAKMEELKRMYSSGPILSGAASQPM